MNNRFYSLNEYCKKTFGEKIYRLSLNGGMTCPNRDGTLSTGGCIFCSEGGSGDFATAYDISITAQIEAAKEQVQKKTDCKHFIAYFQAYTNTYAPIEHLRRIFTEAISHPDIVAISIGTRCDCLSEEVLDLLSQLNTQKPVWVELGLQTMHNKTHAMLNTHTTIEQYDVAVKALHSRGISIITHVILGLPNESKEMMLDTIKHVASLSIQTRSLSNKNILPPMHGIKLQLLHILNGTALAEIYETKPFPLFALEEYCDFIVECLELLPQDMVIHRLTGDGPRKLLVAPLWSTDKKRVLNSIQHTLKERNTYQGRLLNFISDRK